MLAGAVALAWAGTAGASPAPLSQIGGTAGPDAGDLQAPWGVAVDTAGNVFVAESGNDRISQFTAAGTFVRAFGFGVDTGAAAFEVCTEASTCEDVAPSSAAGGLSFPAGIAISGDQLYVADNNNHRISQFDLTGPTFVRAFGFGVDTGANAFETCTTTSGCQQGLEADGAGALRHPYDVAVDGSGALFVADTWNGRISRFTATGGFVHAFGYGVDTGFGLFEVCTETSGCNAAVSDGGAAGGLNFPTGVATDAAGNLYVAEHDNERVSQFTLSPPSLTRAFGFGVDTGAAAFEFCTAGSGCLPGGTGGAAGVIQDPYGVAADGTGGLLVAESSNHRVTGFGLAGPSFIHAFGFGVDTGASSYEVCTAASACQAGVPGMGGGGPGQLNSPVDVAVDCRGNLWVVSSNQTRIQRFGEPGTPLPPCPAQPQPPGGSSSTPEPAKRKCKKRKKAKRVATQARKKKKCKRKKKRK